MSFGPAFDAKEQVRQAVDIVDLIGSYAQLRRSGRNFVALCPWHDDSRPSLQINPDRQSFKCWVCDYGGDIFSFIMRAENLEFREALELLAERAGIELRVGASAPDGAGDRPARPEDDKRTLHRVLAWAEEQFHRCLVSAPEGEPGRAYFAARGITDDTIRRFHLGYAPMGQRWDWLLERARGTEWTPAILERIGLLRRKELNGSHYDWFRGRAMFSIRDARSRPIAFGGRVLPQLADERTAKYINSPETPLFSKSRELYALDIARENFKNDGGAIVMEGYTDVLMAHQHGITNCVAVLGTALGERHVEVLRRYTDNVTLVLDGDSAGQRRTNEITELLLSLFLNKDVNLRILILPTGTDPCDFITKHGSESFRRLLDKSLDTIDYLIRTVSNGLDPLTDTHRASVAVERLLNTLAGVHPARGIPTTKMQLRVDQMLTGIAGVFRLNDERLRERLTTLRRDARAKKSPVYTPDHSSDAESNDAQPTVPARLADLPMWDRDLLELIILDHTMLARVADVIDSKSFSSPVARRIFNGCCRLAEQGLYDDFGRLMAAFDDTSIKNLLVQLDESAATKAKADRERWFADLLDSHRRRGESAGHRATLAAARQSDGDAEQLLAQFCEQSKSKHLSEYERRKK